MIHLGDRSDHWCPIWEIDSKLKYKRNNQSDGKMTTLPLFKIRTNQNQVPPDEDRELSQLLGFARLEDQEDGVR